MLVLTELELHGCTSVEGIYRVSGLATDVQRGAMWILTGNDSGGGSTSEALDRTASPSDGLGGSASIVPADCDGTERSLPFAALRGVHEWAGAVRYALRQYAPLATYQLYDALLRCDAQELPDVLCWLPDDNYGRLSAVCRHLLRVADAADVTRMTRANIAKLWGGVLARRDEAGPRDLRQELRLATEQHRIAGALLDFMAIPGSAERPPRPTPPSWGEAAPRPSAGPTAPRAVPIRRARQLSADEGRGGDRRVGAAGGAIVGSAPNSDGVAAYSRSMSVVDVGTGSHSRGGVARESSSRSVTDAWSSSSSSMTVTSPRGSMLRPTQPPPPAVDIGRAYSTETVSSWPEHIGVGEDYFGQSGVAARKSSSAVRFNSFSLAALLAEHVADAAPGVGSAAGASASFDEESSQQQHQHQHQPRGAGVRVDESRVPAGDDLPSTRAGYPQDGMSPHIPTGRSGGWSSSSRQLALRTDAVSGRGDPGNSGTAIE